MQYPAGKTLKDVAALCVDDAHALGKVVPLWTKAKVRIRGNANYAVASHTGVLPDMQ